ncbi:hypothetical protein [Secundilactobacillus folii]|uniref:Uncharacterized protein n=1 Tax=Secundilactobacillus folii TaxID=2678357 RepID=A0A7X3C1W8_9LACO|nr:hypothetical protein [Secundilactobacillus folii]MTV82200.1 hypothetical protein [Secundilactobacillus folii]
MKNEINQGEYCVNKLGQILMNRNISIKKFSCYTGLSVAAISRIVNNPHLDILKSTAHAISVGLQLKENEWFIWETDYNYNSSWLDTDNLSVLDSAMKKLGVKLAYQVYSNNRSMNVWTKYEGNRKLFIDGNFKVFTNGLPEMVLNGFDVITYQGAVTVEEFANFYASSLSAVVTFAQKIGISKIKYYTSNFSSKNRFLDGLVDPNEKLFEKKLRRLNKAAAERIGFRQVDLDDSIRIKSYVKVL